MKNRHDLLTVAKPPIWKNQFNQFVQSSSCARTNTHARISADRTFDVVQRKLTKKTIFWGLKLDFDKPAKIVSDHEHTFYMLLPLRPQPYTPYLMFSEANFIHLPGNDCGTPGLRSLYPAPAVWLPINYRADFVMEELMNYLERGIPHWLVTTS